MLYFYTTTFIIQPNILSIIEIEHNKFLLNGWVIIPLYRIGSCYALFLYHNFYYTAKTFSIMGTQFENKGIRDKYLTRNSHSAIISIELFKKVQQAKVERGRG